VPMAVALPTDLDCRELEALLGPPVLSRLGFHDLLIGAGDRLRELARTYHLPQTGHLDSDGTETATAVLQLLDQAALHQEVLAQLQARSVRRRDAWSLRTRAGKSAFNIESGAVALELRRIASALPWGTSGRAVVLGCGSGEWLMVAQRAGFKVTGFDLSQAAVQRAHFNYPEVPVRHPGLQPTAHGLAETADVALIAGVLGSLNQEARLRMLDWMWSALRPGGSLIVLDDCVGDRGGDWIPADDLTAAILEATANHAVLEDARALRLDGESFHRVGLITYAKLGAAERL
jgi:SAM-dependent methyltransferase